MPRRIVVLERTVVAVGVQVQGKRIAALAGIRVLLQETRGDRVVHARTQVVHARLGIVLVAREKNVVVSVAGLFEYVAEGVVVVGRGNAAVRRDEGGDVRMGVVRSSRVSGSLVLKDVRTVYVSAGDVPAGLLEKDARVFIEESRADVVDDLFDAQAVAVIDVLDGRAVGGDGADELVNEIGQYV